MTALAELWKHHGHRTVPDEPTQTIRCVDCKRSVLVRGLVASTSTSSSPSKDEQCPLHVGEWADHCRCCASERLAGEEPRAPGPIVPMPEGWLQNLNDVIRRRNLPD